MGNFLIISRLLLIEFNLLVTSSFRPLTTSHPHQAGWRVGYPMLRTVGWPGSLTK